MTLVDGFAGGGEYLLPDGSIWRGSPLIMLSEVEAAQIIQQKKRTKPFKFDAEFIFVEKRRKSAAYLDDAIRRNSYGSQLGSEISVVQSGFEDQVEKIIYRIKSRGTAHRSFFLLDQYGYSTASFSSIRRILTELKNPEILLTFYVDYIIDYLANTPDFLKAVKPTDLDQKKVEELLSMKDQTGGRWFIQRFLLDHVRQATGAKFFTYFFIKSPDSHRSYWLLHLCKHPLARDVMGQQHWDLRNHFIHHGPSGLKMPGFNPEIDPTQEFFNFNFDDDADHLAKATLLEEVPAALFDAHRGNDHGLSITEFYENYCELMPGTFVHLSSTLLRLRDEGEVQILDDNGKLRPRTGNLNWKDRIRTC